MQAVPIGGAGPGRQHKDGVSAGIPQVLQLHHRKMNNKDARRANAIQEEILWQNR